jgi:hypothetical protein
VTTKPETETMKNARYTGTCTDRDGIDHRYTLHLADSDNPCLYLDGELAETTDAIETLQAMDTVTPDRPLPPEVGCLSGW